MQNPMKNYSHFIRGRGRLGATIVNGLEKLGVPVVNDPEQANVIWFCVPERVLKCEAEKLVFTLSTGKRIVHTSGLLPSEAVRVRPDIQVASLHPAYSFAAPLPVMPENILWTFEGDVEMQDLLSPLVSAWNGKWVKIGANAKVPYHIACVLMGNLIDIPVGAAEEICRQFGLPFSDMTESLLIPHMTGYPAGQVLDKITGPAARGDFKTVERETKWLHQNLPKYEEVYKLLSSLIQKETFEK